MGATSSDAAKTLHGVSSAVYTTSSIPLIVFQNNVQSLSDSKSKSGFRDIVKGDALAIDLYDHGVPIAGLPESRSSKCAYEIENYLISPLSPRRAILVVKFFLST